MELTREYYEAVRDCKPGDCGDCILKPKTNRACHMVDVDPRDEARLFLSLMDERDRYRAALEGIEATYRRIDGCKIETWAVAHLHKMQTIFRTALGKPLSMLNDDAALEPR